jgi:thiamine biosynthesis lipoprotein
MVVLASLLACADPSAAQIRREFTEIHMGMPVRVVLHAPDDPAARAAARAAFSTIAALENVFSDYRAFSELRRLETRAGEWVRVSEPLFDVLLVARDVAAATGGAFDPTIGPLTSVWREARRRGKVPDGAAVAAARREVGWRMLALDTAARTVRLERGGMRLDLGGVAKGYVLQQALRTLERHGVRAALIEAGGDIVVGMPPPGRAGWAIAGLDEVFTGRAPAFSHTAIATSGATFQYLEVAGVRYSHVIDARSGQPVTTQQRAHVIARDAALADALATALTVLGSAAIPELRARFPGVTMHVVQPH